jgi:Ca2+-binding EF-hand superfamily protein
VGFTEGQQIAVVPSCPSGLYRPDGQTLCTACGPGKIAAIDFDAAGRRSEECKACTVGTYVESGGIVCTPCVAGYYDHDNDPATVCTACPAGTYSPTPGASTRCLDCRADHHATTSLVGSVLCGICREGYYNYDQHSSPTSCKACNSIDIPRVPPPLNPLSVDRFEQPEVCAGGAPGDAIILPQAGTWIHLNSADMPELLPCENHASCVHVATRGNLSGLAGGKCGEGYEGFLCRECQNGYMKVGGLCIVCTDFSPAMIVLNGAMLVLVALLLLHQSTMAVVSSTEFKQVWRKVDVHDTGFLDFDGVVAVLRLLGKQGQTGHVLAEKLFRDIGLDPPSFYSPHKPKRRGKDSLSVEFYGRGSDLTHCYHQSEHIRIPTLQPHKLIHADDFVLTQKARAPTAAVPTAIFFVQTIGLIGKDASFFGALDALNLDVEKAAGACIAPMTTEMHFVWKVFFSPLILLGLVVVVAPLIWQRVRRLRVLNSMFITLQAPDSLEAVHVHVRFLPSLYSSPCSAAVANHWRRRSCVVQRAVLNSFLFSFTPVTRAAIEVLVCVDTFSPDTSGHMNDGAAEVDAQSVLSVDWGISCLNDEYSLLQIVGQAMWVVYVLIIPGFLLYKARMSRARRDVSLHLEILKIEDLFKETDTDHSGALELEEIRGLLQRLGEPHSPKDMERTMAEFRALPRTMYDMFDADRSGILDYTEIDLLLKELGRVLTDEELTSAHREMDPNGSGDVTFDKFERWMAEERHRSKTEAEQEAQEAVALELAAKRRGAKTRFLHPFRCSK